MSELRTKIAAGVTILAIGGLGMFALSHPQTPPHATGATAQVKHVATPATAVTVAGYENEGSDD
jgi:hypothetical protein